MAAALLLAALIVVGSPASVAAAPPPGNRPPPAPRRPHPKDPFAGLRRLTVITKPAVPGMPFAIDGTWFVADANGIASILLSTDQSDSVRLARDQHLAVVTPTWQYGPSSRASFSGWYGQPTLHPGPIDEVQQIATFDVDFRTTFSFTTVQGKIVKPGDIGHVDLRSNLGERRRLESIQPVWLHGLHTTLGAKGLTVSDVEYRVDAVTTQGVNVVNQAQQRFKPAQQQTVGLRLLFFDVQLAAHDAFFGHGAGQQAMLLYPDGRTRTFRLDHRSAVTARGLPRGSYRVRISGGGLRVEQPFLLSRTTRIDLDVLSWLDLAIVAGAFVLLAAVLIAAGVLLRRRQRVSSARAAEPVLQPATRELAEATP